MPNSNNSPDITAREEGALVRYAAICFIQQQVDDGTALSRAFVEASARPWPETSAKYYAVRTLEDWWYTYRKNGFPSLQRSTRRDLRERRLNAEQQEWIIDQRHRYPKIPVKVAYHRWLEEDPTLPSLTSIYRFLRDNGFQRCHRPDLDGGDDGGPTKAFEAPFPNDLWMTDFSPGPRLRTPDKEVLQTHLLVIIDDHSRLIPFAAYYLNEKTQSFHHGLQQAILRRGLPHKLYADNGSAFISKHSHIVCGNLGIRLIHHKPYRAWSKGKVERVIYSIQSGFESVLSLPGERVHSLEDLNLKLSKWIQQTYHARPHSSTGATPQARFQDGAEHLRQLELNHQSLDRLFHTRVTRTVRKNGTIRIAKQIYEVDLSLRGRRVELRYDPFAAAPAIEVYHQNHLVGNAHPVDLHLNSETDRRNYER